MTLTLKFLYRYLAESPGFLRDKMFNKGQTTGKSFEKIISGDKRFPDHFKNLSSSGKEAACPLYL